MITTHEATKYENYLPVDDLLAPMFFVRESKFLLFLHFSNCIANLRLHTFHSEDGDVELFILFYFFFFFSCPPSGNFRSVIPEMYREGSPIGWTIREFVLQVEISTIFSELPYARRGDDNLHRISSLATGEAPSGTYCRIP